MNKLTYDYCQKVKMMTIYKLCVVMILINDFNYTHNEFISALIYKCLCCNWIYGNISIYSNRLKGVMGVRFETDKTGLLWVNPVVSAVLSINWMLHEQRENN